MKVVLYYDFKFDKNSFNRLFCEKKHISTYN